ncbi:MAG: DUF58 domain-containing protein [Anaerolineales bacterium]|nr:DUF58 domain-containing protein [Anaerolineales bacterium]
MKDFLFILVILFIVAAVFADDFVFTIFYLLAGTYIFSRIWSARSIGGVSYARHFQERVFHGEDVPTKIELINERLLPILWLRLQESVPTELAPAEPLKQVISLGPRGRASFDYVMKARKRGFYTIGPMFASTGDLFGMGGEQRTEGGVDKLTVYPRIVHLTSLKMPSHSPMGTLRHHQPIFEDPSRTMGKRDYVTGDSLRRVDWKASATTGRLQVKQFEPSMALTTAILLNLNQEEYGRQARIDAVEFAIVVAASLANWVVSKKQTVGLITNGTDPLADKQPFKPLLPRKGRNHLMRILDILARVQPIQEGPFVSLLQEATLHLAWGTTLILITGQADEALFGEIFRLRQSGYSVVLILAGHAQEAREAKARGHQFGFPVFHFRNELDLDIWRQ